MPFSAKYSSRFERAYKKLNANDQKDVDQTITAMMENPAQAWLRIKRIQNAKSIKPPVYEASANGNIRITWQYIDEGNKVGVKWKYIYFRNAGNHDSTLNNP